MAIARDAFAMSRASKPSFAMEGERLHLLEPLAPVSDTHRGSSFRATAGAVLVATLALAGIAGSGLLRDDAPFAVTPLGVSPDEEATLRSLVESHDPVDIANDALSVDELGEMAAMLGTSDAIASEESTDDVSSEEFEGEAEEETAEEEASEETNEEDTSEETTDDDTFEQQQVDAEREEEQRMTDDLEEREDRERIKYMEQKKNKLDLEEARRAEAAAEETADEASEERTEEAPEETTEEAPEETAEEGAAEKITAEASEETAEEETVEEQQGVDAEREERKEQEVALEEREDRENIALMEKKAKKLEREEGRILAEFVDSAELGIGSTDALRPDPKRAASFMRIVKAGATGESAAGLGQKTPIDSWTAPTYFITLGRAGESKTIAPALQALTKTFGADAVRRNVRATPGVDIELWPEKLDVAEYAVSGVVARARLAAMKEEPDATHTDQAILGSLPWLDILTKRNKRGKITNPDLLERAHHFGCLLAHLGQWQLARDVGNADTMVFESDGFLPGLLGVPVSSLGAVQQYAPEDYDIVFLHHPGEGPTVGDKITEFTSESGDAIEIYKYEHPDGPSGLSGYMFSERFVEKMLPLIASRGADMVDAWLAGHLCRPLPENDWAYDLPHYEGANGGKGIQWGEKFLNCYKAMKKGDKLPV